MSMIVYLMFERTKLAKAVTQDGKKNVCASVCLYVFMSATTITYKRVEGFGPNLVHRFLFEFPGMSSKVVMILFTISKCAHSKSVILKYTYKILICKSFIFYYKRTLI